MYFIFLLHSICNFNFYKLYIICEMIDILEIYELN